jgi:hypothetical protein
MSDRRSLPTPGKCLRLERNSERFDYAGRPAENLGQVAAFVLTFFPHSPHGFSAILTVPCFLYLVVPSTRRSAVMSLTDRKVIISHR